MFGKNLQAVDDSRDLGLELPLAQASRNGMPGPFLPSVHASGNAYGRQHCCCRQAIVSNRCNPQLNGFSGLDRAVLVHDSELKNDARILSKKD